MLNAAIGLFLWWGLSAFIQAFFTARGSLSGNTEIVVSLILWHLIFGFGVWLWVNV